MDQAPLFSPVLNEQIKARVEKDNPLAEEEHS
jgi:hypothetical protein